MGNVMNLVKVMMLMPPLKWYAMGGMESFETTQNRIIWKKSFQDCFVMRHPGGGAGGSDEDGG